MKELLYPFDSDWIMKNRRKIKKALLEEQNSFVIKRIAVLGGSTTHDIIQVLELFLLNEGIQPVFYESEYGQFYQDGMFGNDTLDRFAPDLIFIHTTNRNLDAVYPSIQDTREQVMQRVEEQMMMFTQLWQSLRDKFHCTIIQNNFEFPTYRMFGNKDCVDVRGRVHFIHALNQRFANYAENHSDFYIHDIQYLSSVYGLEQWAQPFYWYMYKYALSLSAIPFYADSLSHMIQSVFGKNKKALALDLDNTLWGGVIGDDGIDGIEIGQETAVGQSYLEFQSYLRAQKDKGVILTVCSKNERDNALLGLNHPSGVLKPEDFAVIQANWEAKSENVGKIAEYLNILPDSIVFVDDNPAEREIVRTYTKGVTVPELGEVDSYIATLERNGFFEVTAFSEDDLKRNAMYQENALRAQAQQSFTDYGEYLKSLAMKAVIRDFEPVYLPRITQLTNKSNQFNLTTKRYTESEMKAIAENPVYIRLYGQLKDRFGDNGIVSVVIGKKDQMSLHIDLWLMSCRVLKRDMELAMLDTLVLQCKKEGIEEIYGYYYPTKKNEMVRYLYRELGFDFVGEDEDGNGTWKLFVSTYQNRNSYIEIEE